MTYEKQQWINLPNQTTPISGARLNHLETQYDEATAYTDQQIADNPGPRGPAGEIVTASARPLDPGTLPTVTLGGTPSQRTMEFGIPSGEKGESATGSNEFLRQASLYSYGHSFTTVPNSYCRPNAGEHSLRLKSLLGFADVTPNGRGATYLPDTMALALNGVRATDKSRTWPGLTTIASSDNAHGVANGPDYRDMPRGVVLIQNYLNETAYPWALTPEYLEFWKRCLRTLIATTGSKGQKSSTGAIGTTAAGGVHAWADMVATTLYSNLFPDKLLFRSNQAGDYREFRVDGDDIWILTAAGRPSSSSRQLDVYVNGVKIKSLTPAGMMAQDYVPVIAESEAANLWPVALKVSGLNAAAGTTGFKTVRVQVAPTTGWAYLSGALFPRKSPPPVFVAYEPVRRGVSDWEAKDALYRAAVNEVVAEFPQASIADLSQGWDLETMNLAGDIHPNDRGQAKITDSYAKAINETITGWTPGIAVL